ncbi:MAG: gamma-glutamyl-gamma-aminobutyrate hydrolase family protein [Gemmatimonadales bacterium]
MSRLVAVSATRRTDLGRERVALNSSYVRALLGAGLTPVLVPPLLDPTQVDDVLGAVSGLVLTGGEDLHPASYGEAPHARLEETDQARDAVELALYRGARTHRLPVLAICRGIQLVNVAEGGSLYQDLPSEKPSAVNHVDPKGRHALRVEPASLLHRTIGDPVSVNSRHHQAVKQLAPGLRAVAWAEDGIIEGAESADGAAPWLLAVQWHPEDDVEDSLFEGFADVVSGR